MLTCKWRNEGIAILVKIWIPAKEGLPAPAKERDRTITPDGAIGMLKDLNLLEICAKKKRQEYMRDFY